jgi:PAS domain S-box-containing protein
MKKRGENSGNRRAHPGIARKGNEDALRESGSQFRALAESIRAGIFVVQDDRYVFVNPAFCSMSGYTAEELMNMECWDIIAPGMRETAKIKGHAYLEKSGAPFRRDITYVTRTGEEQVGDTNLTVIDFGGKPALLGSVLDVTKRKKAEEALRESEQKYRSIIENAVEGVFQSTPDGRFLGVNPALAAMCGYSSPQEMMSDVRDIAHDHYVDPQDRERLKKSLEKNGSVRHFEQRIRRKDGSVMWVAVTARAVRDSKGNIVRYEGTHQNITERKQAQEELRSAHRHLLDIIEFLPDATFVIDRDRRVIAWNKAIEVMTGVRKEEMLGKGNYEYSVPFYGKHRPVIIASCWNRMKSS